MAEPTEKEYVEPPMTMLVMAAAVYEPPAGTFMVEAAAEIAKVTGAIAPLGPVTVTGTE